MAGMLVLCAVVLMSAVALFGTTYAARKSAAPFFPTPSRAIRKALRAAELKPGETFYDLGAGTGKALIEAEKRFGAKSFGFELSFILYAVAKINLRLRCSEASIAFADLWTAPLHDADVVFSFLTLRTLKKITSKFEKELRPGTRVITYAFPIPAWQPLHIIPAGGQWKIFIYKR